MKICKLGSKIPLVTTPHQIRIFEADRMILASGQLFDMQTWKRLQPPKGRKYHPDLAKFAQDGRFFALSEERRRCELIDTATERSLSIPGSSYFQPKLGWVISDIPGAWDDKVVLRRLPAADHLAKIRPELLELWVQVIVRGKLDGDGNFKPWDESTWERKRQELASKPVPYPDFPFPGHVATDRLHWLRREYEAASDADKPRLARQLLDKAEALGDKAETTRWRRILALPGEEQDD